MSLTNMTIVYKYEHMKIIVNLIVKKTFDCETSHIKSTEKPQVIFFIKKLNPENLNIEMGASNMGTTNRVPLV